MVPKVSPGLALESVEVAVDARVDSFPLHVVAGKPGMQPAIADPYAGVPWHVAFVGGPRSDP